MREALYTVLLWRGHFPVNLGKAKMYLPLHSALLFTVGVIAAEHYSLVPSFILFGISWLLLSMSGNLSGDPSPWKKPFTFYQLTKAVALGKMDPTRIAPYQNREAIETHKTQVEELEKQLAEAAKREEKANAIGNADAELTAMNATEEVNLATKKETKGLTINPLEPYLFPLQQQLQQVCGVLRISRSFITWQEPLVAYWLCIACLLGGIVFLFVPWGFLMRWSIRVIIWTILGPWMALVDIFYIRRLQSEKEAKEAEAAYAKRKLRDLRNTAESRQIKREEMAKLKHMKRYMFGQYLVELPAWKESRYVDVPLMASSATPFVADEASKRSINITDKKFGQHIFGSIIPER